VSQPLFRVPARPKLPARQIDEIPAPPWPVTPEHGANDIGEPLLADVQPPRTDEPIAAADTSAAHTTETAPSMPAGIFDPAFVPAGHPVAVPSAPPIAERPQP
jgi:hypothetical protein